MCGTAFLVALRKLPNEYEYSDRRDGKPRLRCLWEGSYSWISKNRMIESHCEYIERISNSLISYLNLQNRPREGEGEGSEIRDPGFPGQRSAGGTSSSLLRWISNLNQLEKTRECECEYNEIRLFPAFFLSRLFFSMFWFIQLCLFCLQEHTVP